MLGGLRMTDMSGKKALFRQEYDQDDRINGFWMRLWLTRMTEGRKGSFAPPIGGLRITEKRNRS